MAYKLGIIGYPLSHSLSSVMQQAALKSCGFEGTYEVLETKPEELISRIKMLKAQGYNGFNVTIPHKVATTLFVDQFDEYANLSGAINTVKILEDKTLFGYNTDVYGFIHSLPQGFNLQGQNAAVLGTGGAARAVVTALVNLNVKSVTLFTRNVANSHDIVQGFREKFKDIEIKLSQNELLNSLNEFKILVNTTPLGMKNFAAGVSPISDNIIKTLRADGLVYDIVYNPTKTRLIEQAQQFGKLYVGGADMLVYQGARAFEIWTGVIPDVKTMKIALLENLV
jgi:shikimate dehydrogenase